MNGDATRQEATATADGKSAEAVARSRAGWAWTGVGYGFFVLGLVGLALPVLPTTIFWIIAAACFAKSCPAMQRRIFAWPVVGRAVEDFLEHGVIRARSKRAAFMGIFVGAVIVALVSSSLLVTASALGLILVGALYVATRPSCRSEERRS